MAAKHADDGPVAAALRRELKGLPADLAASALAASALVMAQGLDGANSLTSKAMAQGRLQDVMDRLRELAPPKEAKDGIDDLASKRATRRANASGSAAASHPQRS